jgi:hypothetical protein
MQDASIQTVIDYYRARESTKPDVDLDKDGNVRENIRVINCCAYWDVNRVLSADQFNRLVTVICNESMALIKNGDRLFQGVAKEADRQLRMGWKSGRHREWIEKLIHDLEQGASFDPILLREKVAGEPGGGSYYLQDGNHRAIAAGIFLMRSGTMPDLRFHIGRRVDESRFFAH